MADRTTSRKPPAEIAAARSPGQAGSEGAAAALRRDHYALERLQVNTTSLDGPRRELLEALDLRTRRVHQLLGERDQLERQLVRAEKALQQLSRELGAAQSWLPAAAAARAPLLWHALRERLRAGLGRFRLRWDEPGPTAGSERAPSDRAGPLVPFAQAGEQRELTAVVVCGLAPEEREKVLDAVARQSAAGKIVPLVLTDDDDFAPLRSRSMLFEYLPAAGGSRAARAGLGVGALSAAAARPDPPQMAPAAGHRVRPAGGGPGPAVVGLAVRGSGARQAARGQARRRRGPSRPARTDYHVMPGLSRAAKDAGLPGRARQ